MIDEQLVFSKLENGGFPYAEDVSIVPNVGLVILKVTINVCVITELKRSGTPRKCALLLSCLILDLISVGRSNDHSKCLPVLINLLGC